MAAAVAVESEVIFQGATRSASCGGASGRRTDRVPRPARRRCGPRQPGPRAEGHCDQVLADEARRWQEDTRLPFPLHRQALADDRVVLFFRCFGPGPTASDPGVGCLCLDPVVGQSTAWETRSQSSTYYLGQVQSPEHGDDEANRSNRVDFRAVKTPIGSSSRAWRSRRSFAFPRARQPRRPPRRASPGGCHALTD